ncbi:hypothetical protein BU14_1260s0002 [Porphyra umbilicalis]|uniref:Uncharacterized protein n=1 Tax=Porphyra umbilicalis TaxID=2786 RepID=A0A1X6NMD5_PORUM|nr:hypothetical protein BU14_1260s0002 [Porphyra umbilicalis]|eukprot:OSX69700.1 hypothetical protein BU14_1260s0002 [Porphyra umbilicalis]
MAPEAACLGMSTADLAQWLGAISHCHTRHARVSGSKPPLRTAAALSGGRGGMGKVTAAPCQRNYEHCSSNSAGVDVAADDVNNGWVTELGQWRGERDRLIRPGQSPSTTRHRTTRTRLQYATDKGVLLLQDGDWFRSSKKQGTVIPWPLGQGALKV